jgi:cell division protein FtsB
MRGRRAAALLAATALLLATAWSAAAQPKVFGPRWEAWVESEGAFEPGERVKVRLCLNFTETGAYGAFFYVVIPVSRGGAVGWVAAARGELKTDVYEPGVQKAEVELTVPEDVFCGFPPYVYAGLVWATAGKEAETETYAFPLGVPACLNTTAQAVAFWRGVGGKEGLQQLANLTAQLKEENQQLRGQLADLADRIKRLEAEKGALQAEVERQSAESAQLKARLEALQTETERQSAENAALRQRAAALEAENVQLKTGAVLLAAAATAATAVALLRRRK